MVVHDEHIIFPIVDLETLSKGQIEFHEECNFYADNVDAAAGAAGDDDCHSADGS